MQIDLSPIPEPSTLMIAGAGLMIAGLRRRRF
ncbi:PEP-CTERM sorting domain-containing protein [Luteolibacter luteus]|uniref:PEP-CTERM sorting domain-containing protein n=1 Tax=Luteolibacter luteus TaxID=2728835 RepID=A0A858RS56_9BACT|nr:PEP-CTERM sorting domain-containing protein [Luteolibacter luteus]